VERRDAAGTAVRHHLGPVSTRERGPFLGAGASLCGRPEGNVSFDEKSSSFLPTGSELAHLLADESSFPDDRPGERDNLAKVASYYEVVVEREVLRSRLHKIFCGAVDPVAFEPGIAPESGLAALVGVGAADHAVIGVANVPLLVALGFYFGITAEFRGLAARRHVDRLDRGGRGPRCRPSRVDAGRCSTFAR